LAGLGWADEARPSLHWSRFEGGRIIPPWYSYRGPFAVITGLEGARLRLLMPLALAVAMLVCALCLPRGFPTSLFYMPLILCGLSFPRPHATLLLAGIATLASQFAYMFKAPAVVAPWMSGTHQLILMATLWLIALLVFQHHKSLLRLRIAQDRAAFLASIVESTDDAVIGLNTAGVIHSWNAGAEKMFGFSADERIGRRVAQLVPEYQLLLPAEIEAQLRRQIGLRNFEATGMRKDGTLIELAVTASPILDANGECIGLSAILRDNTALKKMLEQNRQNESRYQLLVRGLNVGEWDWNVVTNELFWSPRFLHIIGITETEFLPHYSEFESRLHPEDKARVVAQLNAHVLHRTPYDTEYRLRRQNGTYVWIHATGQGFQDDEGRVIRMVGSVDDISERKMAEERFQKIVEFSPYPIVVIDTAGEIVLTNRQTEDLFGYLRHEFFKKTVEQLIPERFRARHPQHRADYFGSGAVQVQETRRMGSGMELFALRKDGTEVPVEIGLIPIQTATHSYVLATIIDISPRLEAEAQTRRYQEDLQRQVAERTAQLAASNRELEDFASLASHDLKAPLRGIRSIAGFLEVDLEAYLTPQSRRHVNQLNLRVQRMEKLLDDLLEYARINDPGDANSSETLRGDALMQEIIGLLAPPEGFQITLAGPFAQTQLRRMPLQQVLMNLIGNAIKHHDKVFGNICVSIEDTGPEFAFTVADDGPGIAKKFQERAFKMFQTLKPRDQADGSGMGLAVVRKHVATVGGTLSLDSEANAGCVFRFTWPK
jgi:PAS domain S-box-containing protein